MKIRFRILALLSAFLLLGAFISAAPARAGGGPLPIHLQGWGGGEHLTLAVGFGILSSVVITLSAQATQGQFIVVFAQGGWQNYSRANVISDTAGDTFTVAQNTGWFVNSPNPSFWPSYYGTETIAWAIAKGNVTGVLVNSNYAGNDWQYWVAAGAFAYTNATGIGAVGFATSVSQSNTLTLTLTQTNTTVAFLGTELQESNNNGCPQAGSSNTATLGSASAYSYLTTTGSTREGYFNACDSNGFGMRQFDSAGSTGGGPGTVYTTPMQQYQVSNAFAAQSAEIIPNLGPVIINGFDIGQVFSVMLFLCLLGLGIAGSWEVRKRMT